MNVLAFTLISLALVGISIVPHNNLHAGTNVTNTQLGSIYSKFRHLNAVNEYGQHLRKMRSERLEIVLEHANHMEGPWVEYGNQYKPWNVNHSLPFSGPYLPRLDFKFYDAAISNYNDQLWVSSLAYRLLQNDRFVLQLLGVKKPLDSPPKFVRGVLYKFRYTGWKDRHNQAYWTRNKLAEFLPAYSLEHGPMLSYLKSLKINPNAKPVPIRNEVLQKILDVIRNQTYSIEGSLLVFGVLTAGFVIIATQKRK